MWNPVDHMNAARANKPASGGKRYAKITPKSAYAKPESEHAMFCYQLRQDWTMARKQIMQQWENTMYPERYEEFI